MADDKDYLEKSDKEQTAPDNTSGDEEEFEKIRFMCRRPESKAGKMIDLPNDIHICVECMQKSFDTMNNAPIDYNDLMKTCRM